MCMHACRVMCMHAVIQGVVRGGMQHGEGRGTSLGRAAGCARTYTITPTTNRTIQNAPQILGEIGDLRRNVEADLGACQKALGAFEFEF